MDNIHFTGIIIGVATFFIIGLFHPLVIKGEYYFGVKSWWVFCLVGIIATIASLLVADDLIKNSLAIPRSATIFLNMNSAIGLRQILP